MNFVFLPGNSPVNPALNGLIQQLQNVHIQTSATQGNEFKAFLYDHRGILAFAVGRYPTQFGQNVSNYPLIWTAILDWIETAPIGRGQGICTPFLANIFRELIKLRLYHVQIINVGGTVACRCYVRAAYLVDGIPTYYDGKSGFDPIRLENCTSNTNVDLVILPDAARMNPSLVEAAASFNPYR